MWGFAAFLNPVQQYLGFGPQKKAFTDVILASGEICDNGSFLTA